MEKYEFSAFIEKPSFYYGTVFQNDGARFICSPLSTQDEPEKPALVDHLQVGLVAQVQVSSSQVPRIKGVEPDVVQTFLRDRAGGVILQYTVKVIIVTPRKKYVV